jgi:hypothetical protein
MKTILTTGGASGFGKGIALHYLKKGDRVIAVGSSSANGDIFLSEAKGFGAEERAVFIKADLSLKRENKRIIGEINERFTSLDMLVFCASKHSAEYTETAEGIELTFALDYLSRFILSYGLKESLEKTDGPVVLNICGTGMKGEVNWNDLEHKEGFHAQKVMMHGSRLNDLSGVSFSQNDAIGKIKYVLYNPMAVRTPGMMEFGGPLMKMVYKIIGKPVEKAASQIAELLETLPLSSLSAYRERKKLELSLATYSEENAKRLYGITIDFLKTYDADEQ